MWIARVIFLGPEKGGRFSPPQTGYHPQLEVGDEYTSCRIESLSNVSTFEFDREHEVSLKLLFSENYDQYLHIGSDVRFFEGSKLIGIGKISNWQR